MKIFGNFLVPYVRSALLMKVKMDIFQEMCIDVIPLAGCWFWAVEGRGFWWSQFRPQRYIWVYRSRVYIHKLFHNKKRCVQLWYYTLWAHHCHPPTPELNGICQSCKTYDSPSPKFANELHFLSVFWHHFVDLL